MNIAACLQAAREKLGASVDNPNLEAALLLAHVLKQSRSYLFAHPEEIIAAADRDTFFNYVERRLQQEPLAYLIGTREFWSLDLSVTRDTLIPRPETELLVETALGLFGQQSMVKAADMGTGTGAIALALATEKKNWRIDATDISEKALNIARNNAQHFGLNNITFHLGSWCTALPSSDYDLIISNPPYISLDEWPAFALGLQFEPYQALVSGQDGLDDIREIIKTAKAHLRKGGYLLVEHGYQQAAAVREVFLANAYQSVHSLQDFAGNDRVTIGSY